MAGTQNQPNPQKDNVMSTTIFLIYAPDEWHSSDHTKTIGVGSDFKKAINLINAFAVKNGEPPLSDTDISQLESNYQTIDRGRSNIWNYSIEEVQIDELI